VEVLACGFACGPRGSLVGLHRVGLRRCGVSRAAMHRLRPAYRMLSYGKGRFAERAEIVSREFEGHPIVGKIVGFIRDGGSRPLMKARPLRDAGISADAEIDGPI